MPNNLNRQDAALKQELLTLLQEKYRLMFLKKLGSVDGILSSLNRRYDVSFKSENKKEALERLFDGKIYPKEDEVAAINEFFQPEKITQDNFDRVTHFFGSVIGVTVTPDVRDKTLSLKARFILDAIHFDLLSSLLGDQLESLRNNEASAPEKAAWNMLLEDFDFYKKGQGEGYPFEPLVESSSTHYINKFVRNPQFTEIKKIEDDNVPAPAVDEYFISIKNGTVTVDANSDIFEKWMSENKLSLEEIDKKIEEIDNKLEDIFPNPYALLKNKYRFKFIEQLSSAESIAEAIHTRHRCEEPVTNDFVVGLFDDNDDKRIETLITRLGEIEIPRLTHVFGDEDKNKDKLHPLDAALSLRTRFILDAVSYKIADDFKNELTLLLKTASEVQLKDLWLPLFADFSGYKNKINNLTAAGMEDGKDKIYQACLAVIPDYVNKEIRNSLLETTKIKSEKGLIPLIDDNIVSRGENNNLEINQNIIKELCRNHDYLIQEDGKLSREKIQERKTELSNKFKEFVTSEPQEIKENAPQDIKKQTPKTTANQVHSQKPASKSGIGSTTRLALEAGGILGSSGIGAGVGALLGTFVFPGVGTALGAIAGSVIGAAAGVTAVGMVRGLTKNPLAGSLLATAGASGLGAAIGGIMGTFVFPGLGTAVGAGIGAASGFVTGAALSAVVGVGAGLSRLFNRADNSSKGEPAVSSKSDSTSNHRMNNLGLARPEPQITAPTLPASKPVLIDGQQRKKVMASSVQLASSPEVERSSSSDEESPQREVPNSCP